MPEVRTLCHCKAVEQVYNSPSLPLEGIYYHSTAIRRSIGFPSPLLAQLLPGTHRCTIRGSEFIRADAFPPLSSVSFCVECGTTLGAASDGKLFLNAGAIVITKDEKLVKIVRHVGLRETYAGGMNQLIDDGLPRFADTAGNIEWKGPEPRRNSTINAEFLTASCRCGDVKVRIERPPENWKEDELLREWVKPDRTLCRGLCFCNSCRASSGTVFFAWAFVPSTLLKLNKSDTLKWYRSSEDVRRGFCGRCGTTLFFDGPAGRGKMWDVAIGSLENGWVPEEVGNGWFADRHNGDVKDVDRYIEGWLDGKVAFEEDADNWAEVLQAVKKGCEIKV